MAGRWVYIALTVAAVLLLIFPVSAWPLQSWLRFGLAGQPAEENAAALRIEAQDWRSQLNILSGAAGLLPSNGNYVAALVYSRYPFNFKNEILVNAGEKAGVKVGAAAIVPGDGGSVALLGRVETVWSDKSLVRTVFDPRFQLAVRVGPSAADALLTGGSEPKLTLIGKTAGVKAGDSVYAVTEDLPYGLSIGLMRASTLSSDELFREAVLDLPYDLNSVRIVWLKK